MVQYEDEMEDTLAFITFFIDLSNCWGGGT